MGDSGKRCEKCGKTIDEGTLCSECSAKELKVRGYSRSEWEDIQVRSHIAREKHIRDHRDAIRQELNLPPNIPDKY